MTPFSTTLRRLRTERQQPLKVVASVLDIHITYLSAIETGRRPPPKDPQFYKRLTECLNLSLSEIAELREHADRAPLYSLIQGRTSQQQARFVALIFDLAAELEPWEIETIEAILERNHKVWRKCSPKTSSEQQEGAMA